MLKHKFFIWNRSNHYGVIANAVVALFITSRDRRSRHRLHLSLCITDLILLRSDDALADFAERSQRRDLSKFETSK